MVHHFFLILGMFTIFSFIFALYISIYRRGMGYRENDVRELHAELHLRSNGTDLYNILDV